MNWLRRLLGSHEQAPSAHVQEATDAVAAANESFAEVLSAVDEMDEALGRSNRAQGRVIRDYLDAERQRTKT